MYPLDPCLKKSSDCGLFCYITFIHLQTFSGWVYICPRKVVLFLLIYANVAQLARAADL